MLAVEKTNIDQLCPEDYSLIRYAEIKEEQRWAVEMIKELIDVKWGEMKVDGFSSDELSYILDDICTN